MTWFCEKCKKLHADEEMCPHIQHQLQSNPHLLVDAANFTAIAGQYGLVTSNALDSTAQQVNQLIGTNLSYEGTLQVARDVQVFKRLNEEAFVKCGVFSSPEAAQTYLNNATKGQMKNIVGKVNGSAQEVAWLREQQSKISSLWQKSELLNKNAVGVDGVVYNRFTGKEITRVTIKATQSQSGLNTNVQQIIKAVKMDRLNPNETVFGVEGTEHALLKKLDKEILFAEQQGDFRLAERLRKAKSLKVIEYGTPEGVKASNTRMTNKIKNGQATTHITPEQLNSKMCEGAIIGAVVGLTVSAITSYIRYCNGELTQQEAFSQVTEDTMKSAIVGTGTAAVTLFIPGGAIGFIGGMAVGIYLNATCTNILDEVFGKGAYGAILNASGYIYGMTTNLETAVASVAVSMHKTQEHLARATDTQRRIDSNLSQFSKELGGVVMTTAMVSIQNTPSGVEDLITASQQLLAATEQQFEGMRKEQWFNRVFDMITFSQKKDIRLGEQIQTLSQAQNIVLEILPRMAGENAEIAAYIEKDRERIESLTQNDLTLLRLYKNLYRQLENERLGVKKSQDIAILPEVDRLALSGCLRLLSQKFDRPSDLQQRYFNKIHSYIGCESEGDVSFDSFRNRPEDARKQVLQCCLEYIFLYQNDIAPSDELMEFIDNFDLGSRTVKERLSLVHEMFHARGAEGIIEKYSDNDINEDIPNTFVIEYGTAADVRKDVADVQLDGAPEHNFDKYYRLAVNGDPEAQCQVGICYYNGIGVEQNIQEAIEWYRKSADQGYPDAQNRLGVRYDNGDGIQEDCHKAFSLFQKAAEQGHIKATCNLGKCYYYGRGVDEDSQKAFDLFKKASSCGDVNSQFYLGLCYYTGDGTEEDASLAFSWFEKSANQGDSDGQYYLGLCYLRGEGTVENEELAFTWFQKSAEQGNPDGQYLLATCYFRGWGTDIDNIQAVYWHKKSALQGQIDAQFALGCYYSGELGTIEPDYDQSLVWLRKAAEKNHAGAEYSIGYFYQNGSGVEKDLNQALSWYRKAALHGSSDAMRQMGVLYMYGGKNIKKDLNAAEKNFRNAINAIEVDESDSEEIAKLHYQLAEVIYARNVYDNLSINGIDVALMVPGVNLAALPLRGVMSAQENKKLKEFLKTSTGKEMLQYYRIAAELGHANARKKLKKIDPTQKI